MSFRISYSKAIEAILWMAGKQPGIDIYHVAKILFYADKMHLNKYGRLILGDTYVKMDYGPVPSGVLDLLRKNGYMLGPDHVDMANAAFDVDNDGHPSVNPLRQPDLDYFSKSDIECLEASFNENAHLTFQQLVEATHAERCYNMTPDRGLINQRLMLDEELEDYESSCAEFEELSAYVLV